MHFSWAGLFDGRYDNLTLADLLLKDDKYDNTRERVRNCDVILLDEVSMLSRKDFEQLGMVCRLARENNNIFGGIQVMASWDFYQLLPVPNLLYNESGHYAFESNLWGKVFTHKINLKTIVRQIKAELINTVRETAKWVVSKDSEIFLKNLQRNISDNVKPVHLSPKNIDVAVFNHEQLDLLHSGERVYTAEKKKDHKNI